jgi:hypothetical protein
VAKSANRGVPALAVADLRVGYPYGEGSPPLPTGKRLPSIPSRSLAGVSDYQHGNYNR